METLPRRKPLRLPEYNYSQGGTYFLTVCIRRRICCLSSICVGGGALDAPQVRLTAYGAVVREWIHGCHSIYSDLTVEKYVVMPNHIHLLVTLRDGPSGAPAPTERRTNQRIPLFISALKRMTAKRCGENIWQDGYYDHVVRNEEDYLRIWNYIHTNPAKWAEDKYYVP